MQIQCLQIISDGLANLGQPYVVKCDHIPIKGEEIALFIGPKQLGKGRGSRIAEVDLIVLDTNDRSIKAIVEVDPDCTPKKFLSNVTPALIADNHTSSYSFEAYVMKATKVLFVTNLSNKTGSQKAGATSRINPTG